MPSSATQWKQGQSGNPAGRPKGVKTMADILRRIGKVVAPESTRLRLSKLFGKEMPKLTMQEAVLWRVYEAALRGYPWAVKFIAERTEGKVKETIDENVTIVPTAEEMARWLSLEELTLAETEGWDARRIRALIAARVQDQARQGIRAGGPGEEADS